LIGHCALLVLPSKPIALLISFSNHNIHRD
jgi:hypothetical protein